MGRFRHLIRILEETSEPMVNATGVMAGAPKGVLMLVHRPQTTEVKELKPLSIKEDPIKMKSRRKQRLVMVRIPQTITRLLAIKEL
jgi:hypothetical protein